MLGVRFPPGLPRDLLLTIEQSERYPISTVSTVKLTLSKTVYCIIFLCFLILPSNAFALNTPIYDETISLTSSSNGSYYYASTTDKNGDIYVAGYFSGTMDVDPTSGEDIRTSANTYDTIITKFSQNGTYLWSKTINARGAVYKFVFDDSNNMYLGIYFSGTGDFDWSSGTDNHTSNGLQDAALTKINSDGTYGWTRTFGGASYDQLRDIAVDNNGYVYITSTFQGTADFDPTGGVNNITSNGNADVAISKFSNDGTYIWTKAFGGTGTDIGYIKISPTNQYFYVYGRFDTTVDFDPSGSTTSKTSAGGSDAFLAKFDLDGNFQSVKTLSSTGTDQIYDLKFVDNDFYIVGAFGNTVDFDLGSGTENHTANGTIDAFLAKYTNGEELVWVKNWGAASKSVYGNGLTVSNGNVYISGGFDGTIDFDPSSGTDIKTGVNESGGWDGSFFVSEFDVFGNYLWSHTSTGGIYSTGSFPIITNNMLWVLSDVAGTVDFDPYGNHDYKTGDPDNEDSAIIKFLLPVPSSTQSTLVSNYDYQLVWTNIGNERTGYIKPIIDSDTGHQQIDVMIQPGTLKFNAFLSAKQTKFSSILDKLSISVPKNIVQTSGNPIGLKINGLINWQVGDIQEIWYKAYPPEGSGLSPTKIDPSLLSKSSILILSYTDADLVPSGDVNHPFSPNSLKLAYSPDGINWKIIPNSVLDTKNHTIAVVQKIGGYYMIVANPFVR